jgi:hypothetical protein
LTLQRTRAHLGNSPPVTQFVQERCMKLVIDTGDVPML